MNSFLIAQILGFFALLSSIIGVWQKQRIRFIILNIIQNIFSGVQYLLLGKDIAFYLCLFGVFRLILYSFRNNLTLKSNIVILIVCLIVNIFISLLNYSDIYDLIPLIASTLVCYTVWQSKIFIIRLGVIISKALWGIFATISFAYFSILMDIFLIIWTIFVIIRDKRKQIKN